MSQNKFNIEEDFITATKNSDKVQKSTQEIFQSTYKFGARVGFLGGLLPLQNAMNSKIQVSDLIVKRVSWHHLYSCCTLLIKVWILYQFGYSMHYYTNFVEMRQNSGTATNYYAGLLAFGLTFFLGPFVHVLCAWRASYFLKMLQCIDNYDKKYHSPIARDNKYYMRGRRVRLIGTVMSSLMFIFAPLHAFRVISTKAVTLNMMDPDPDFQPPTFSIIPGLFQTQNTILIYIYLVLGMFFLELGNTFTNFQMFFSSRLLIFHLSNFVTLIREKRELEEDHNTKLKKVSLPEKIITWELLGRQFTDFLDTFKMYQIFIGPYFTFVFSVTMTASTCMIYFLLTSNDVVATECKELLTLIVIFSIGRIFGLVDCGEGFQVIHKKIILEVMTSYQCSSNEKSLEKSEMNRVIRLVTSSKIIISASGFFIVCRKNVTSIISAVITYIIVLLQFSSSGNETVLTTSNSFNDSGIGSPCDNCSTQNDSIGFGEATKFLELDAELL